MCSAGGATGGAVFVAGGELGEWPPALEQPAQKNDCHHARPDGQHCHGRDNSGACNSQNAAAQLVIPAWLGDQGLLSEQRHNDIAQNPPVNHDRDDIGCP